MAIRMPGPVALASGVFHLNIRVPSDLVHKVRGSRVSPPIETTDVAVKVGEKVIVSLRTRDVAIAKARLTAAAAALATHWAAVRAGPKGLSHRETVALAGDAVPSGNDITKGVDAHRTATLLHLCQKSVAWLPVGLPIGWNKHRDSHAFGSLS